jgi:hypothetical protein
MLGTRPAARYIAKQGVLCPYLVEQPYLAASEHSLGNGPYSRGKFKGVLERLAQGLGLCMVIALNSASTFC